MQRKRKTHIPIGKLLCMVAAVAEVKIITHVTMYTSSGNEPMARITIIPGGMLKILVNIPQVHNCNNCIRDKGYRCVCVKLLVFQIVKPLCLA